MSPPHSLSSTSGKHLPAEGLPLGSLLALAMTGLISIMTETLPAGLLPEISAGLAISPSQAGQLVTAYALGSMLAVLPLTIITQHWRRRMTLLTAVFGFLIFNIATALSTDYIFTLFVRFMAGVAAGLSWSLIAGYARRLVKPELQGRAVAVAMLGTPIALSIGVPAGTWLGHLVGWRMAFHGMSLFTVALVVWILLMLPDFPGQTRAKHLGLWQVLCTPGVRPVLVVILTWMLAHNILYTYIAPYVAQAGLASQVDMVLLVFGVAALGGIGLIGRLVDRHLRTATLASLVVFSLGLVVMGIWADISTAVYISTAIWGITFGGAATLLVTAVADAAGEGADVAVSLTVVVWNAAIAGGGFFGGMLLKHVGVVAFPWLALLLIAVGLAVVVTSYRFSFKPGPRAHANH
ncbi:MFS transporter [Pectobacterium carotovorum]|uniref:MFS transporter n=1 Tax=Pectobacterium carotovorum TaxID=554 RepID=UPI00207E9CD6|nr:MFS transporter [Pectobacterium carotovorum]GKW37494.1 MFS transporter [Pectobacterium carotovorum subsp. carotovorum]